MWIPSAGGLVVTKVQYLIVKEMAKKNLSGNKGKCFPTFTGNTLSWRGEGGMVDCWWLSFYNFHFFFFNVHFFLLHKKENLLLLHVNALSWRALQLEGKEGWWIGCDCHFSYFHFLFSIFTFTFFFFITKYLLLLYENALNWRGEEGGIVDWWWLSLTFSYIVRMLSMVKDTSVWKKENILLILYVNALS